jgi:hypothetical protein
MNHGTDDANVKPACCGPAALLTMSSSACVPELDWARSTKPTLWLLPEVSAPGLLVATRPP